MGNVHNAQGQDQEALQMYKQSYLQFKDTVGRNHYRTIAALFKIAIFRQRQGRLLLAK